MKYQITKRDVKFFILGALAMFLVVIIYEWKDFKDGFTGAFSTKTEITK